VEGEFRGTRRFTVRRRLGAGGMGVVYEAYDREQQISLALKTLRQPSPDAVLRLKNEFRALQDIQHPNLVHLGELFEDDGVWFFTMELVRGTTLIEYLRPGARPEWSESMASTAERDLTTPTLAAVPILAQVRAAGAGMPRAQGSAPGVARVPAARGFDEARVRDALAQLTRGLSALHSAGKVHRDVKPSNILVDSSGRVVLLDFGLVADTARGSPLSEVGMAGTAAYMAPEQALGKPVGPESDWYSLGVVLYEALTGVLPFEGSQLQILMQKQQALPPPRPAAQIVDVPEDLDRMCSELLERDPLRRPTGPALMRSLGVAESASPSDAPPPVTRAPTALTHVLVGREPELAALGAALEDVRAGRLVCCYVHGESGIGKSALVRVFCQRAAADPRVVVLAGRCYERENVPYRVLDGVIDSLSRHLHRLPKHEAAALIPQRVSLLLQVFPALKGVEVFVEQQPRKHEVEIEELRTRAFGALRELITRLAERCTLILAIEDLQWADVDGLELLSDLMRPPDAPAFLLVGSWREAGQDPAGVLGSLEALPGEARHLRVTGLPESAAHELAERLLVHAGVTGASLAARARSIAREAVGHPLFIDELVRSSAIPSEPTDTTQAPLKLADVLWARIGRLDPISRRVLEVVAVASAPIDQDTAACAAALDLATLGRHAGMLRVANLVRTTGSRSTDTLEPYHDRVRDAVLDNLAAEETVDRHRELAHALDASGRADPEDLIEHYRGAHEPARAGRCAAQAAANAAQALAFDQAARLYQLALELLPESDPDRRDLRVRLGDALASAGRGSEAAQAYLAAAEGASAADKLDLELRAAQQLLLTGHIDESIVTLRSFLEREGIRYPRTPRQALLMLVTRRGQLRLRGLGFAAREERRIPPKDLQRLDVCFGVGQSLAMVDYMCGAAILARGLLLALRAGEPTRLARALMVEGVTRAASGGKGVRDGEALVTTAEGLVTAAGNPQVLALAATCRAQICMLSGRFRASLESCERARTIMREHRVGEGWERTEVDVFACWALYFLGDFDRLARWMPELRREFARCNNQYALTSLGLTALSYLNLAIDDDPAQHRAEIHEAATRWSPSGFHVQHCQAVFAEALSRLYVGDGAAAHAYMQTSWPTIERSLILHVEAIRVQAYDLRARTALAAAAPAGSPAQRKQYLAAAARDAGMMQKVHEPYVVALAQAILSCVAQLRGDLAGARSLLAGALAGFEASEMALHVAAARRRLGALVGGDEGRALLAASDAYMTANRIRRPERMTQILLPLG
jgi:serine/threonine protein kinase/tetratricopeptide (TPR) repeat protein